MIRFLQASMAELENDLSLPKGFLDILGFNEKDDWSFLIKLHALFESAISSFLTQKFGEELSEFFSYIELSNKKAGKIAFLKALNILDDAERRYVAELSEIRNKLVHDISNVNFNLTQYLQDKDDIGREKFRKTFAYYLEAMDKQGRIEFIQQTPRELIFIGGLLILIKIYNIQKAGKYGEIFLTALEKFQEEQL